MKFQQETILDLALLLIGFALCAFGLWLLLSPAKYRAGVEINVVCTPQEKVRPGIYYDDGGFDPYFIVDVAKEIKTSVLTNVAAALNLKDGGRLLAKRMDVCLFGGRHDSHFWVIDVTSETPDEAALLANTIAKCYVEYGDELVKEEKRQRYQEQEQQISALRTKVGLLRQKFQIQSDVSTNRSLEEQSYWDEKQKFDRILFVHELRLLQTNYCSTVQIQKLAIPPTDPDGSNRLIGAVLLILGLFSVVAGFRINASFIDLPRFSW